jgi:hypothetical protein
MDYRYRGKRRTLAFRVYSEVSLAAARTAGRGEETTLGRHRSGSPTQAGQAGRECALRKYFRAIAEELVEKHIGEGNAPATLIKKRWLLEFAYPYIGKQAHR